MSLWPGVFIFLFILMQSVVFATDYQVSVYLNEIRAGYAPAYTSTVTIMNTSGKVVKTTKNVFQAPVITMITANKNCRTVSVKEQDPPLLRGIVVVCNGDPIITTPDTLQLLGEPK